MQKVLVDLASPDPKNWPQAIESLLKIVEHDEGLLQKESKKIKIAIQKFLHSNDVELTSQSLEVIANLRDIYSSEEISTNILQVFNLISKTQLSHKNISVIEDILETLHELIQDDLKPKSKVLVKNFQQVYETLSSAIDLSIEFQIKLLTVAEEIFELDPECLKENKKVQKLFSCQILDISGKLSRFFESTTNSEDEDEEETNLFGEMKTRVDALISKILHAFAFEEFLISIYEKVKGQMASNKDSEVFSGLSVASLMGEFLEMDDIIPLMASVKSNANNQLASIRFACCQVLAMIS